MCHAVGLRHTASTHPVDAGPSESGMQHLSLLAYDASSVPTGVDAHQTFVFVGLSALALQSELVFACRES